MAYKILKRISKRKDDIICVMTIAGFYALMELMGITCPIRFVTGVSCAGCGMSRAWLSLLHLDFKLAFYYHPLFIVPAAVVLLFLFRKRIPKKILDISAAVIILLFLSVYIVRMMSPDNDIVVFSPTEGAIYRVYLYVKDFIGGNAL